MKPAFPFFFNYPHLRPYLLSLETSERTERERNIDMKEKHGWVASCMYSDQGPNLQPRHVS